MKIKTYGINGLTDWHGDIKVGSISVKVSFTGGTASPSGARPAYYVTKDPIAQFVIENSKEFKEGFIHIEMVQEVAGEHRRMAVPKPAPAVPAPAQAPVHAPAEEPVKEENPAKEEEDKGVAGNVITVADKKEAIDWLKDKHPEKEYTTTKLRTKEAFEAACAECGVTFEITA